MSVDLIGHEIKGRYRLIDERGSGNFGTVYIARDLLTNYLYAAKIMRIDYTDDNELVERFKREAFILYNLNDEHIVRVIDYGNEGNLYYIILHHVDGQNLKYYIQREGKIPPLRALDYVHQAAEGLNAAYKRGVVHRDIKPQNILVNNKGVVKIADFGLSRSKDMHTITGSDKFMGTAYYVAPEQITNSHEVDTRADLYSLTVLLFEMLTGHPPYSGDRILDVVLKHARAEIPSVCLLCPGLPSEADRFMQKALAKTPQERFQSPAEYIAAIEQLQRLLRGNVEVPQKQARLVLLESGEVFPLYGSKLLIGREDPKREIHPDITLNDEQRTVGRIHASLSYQQGQWSIEDRNSRNRTRLNGEILVPYERRPLKDGDQLRFGRVEARFELR
ncbi:MAG TPA: FHA domain-containing serine/threonine-protein kinase [Ktedonobacteraceae bacterium]|jgi:serine/threonine protein kinase|nr:FHA domain-containing serine/threonine-protein kinase [Ktedonobacteraceae bacterium]